MVPEWCPAGSQGSPGLPKSMRNLFIEDSKKIEKIENPVEEIVGLAQGSNILDKDSKKNIDENLVSLKEKEADLLAAQSQSLFVDVSAETEDIVTI